jgi:amino acid transporter
MTSEARTVSTNKPPVFAREATGLVKNVTFWDAITLNVANMSAGSALALIGYTMVLLPTVSGVNLVYGSMIAFGMSIPQIIVYSMMSRRMPRTGGDYVWLTRSIGGFLGGPLSLFGYALGNLPYLALTVLSAVFAIGSVGVALGNMSYLGLALPGNLTGAQPAYQFLIGAAIYATIVGVNLVRPKGGYKLVAVLTSVGLIAWIVSIAVLLSAGTTGVQNYINGLAITNTTYTSVASSYAGPNFDFGNTVGLLIPFFAFFTYPWLNAAPAVGSELRGKQTLRWNVAISGLVSFLVVTISFGAMYYAGGFAFITGALANSNLVYNYSFNFWTLAMGVAPNAMVATFIGIGWIVWVLAIVAYLVIVEARYLLAFGFDRFLPTIISRVDDKRGSPDIALLVDFGISIVLMAGAAFLYGTLVSLYGTIVAPMIYFMFIGIGAAVYAVKREKGTSKIVLIVSGLLMAVVFAYFTYQFLTFPAIWGGNNLAYGYIAFTFVLGIVIYLASKSYYSKQGIDIGLAFKEIPPE